MKAFARSALLVSGLTLSLPLLQGCFPAAVVGVGAGALMLADRRPSETYIADQAVEVRIANRLNERFGDKVHASATSFDLKVLLTGEVPDAAIKEEVEKIAAAVPNVKGTVNELQIGANSSFGARSNDTYVTSKVKARFVEANKFAPNYVKVVTEAGVVYLMGIVTQREADDATALASTTDGVRKVVRIFEYIDEARARQLDNRPASAPAK